MFFHLLTRLLCKLDIPKVFCLKIFNPVKKRKVRLGEHVKYDIIFKLFGNWGFSIYDNVAI